MVKKVISFRLDPELEETVHHLKLSKQDSASDVLRRMLIFISRSETALEAFNDFQKSGLLIAGSTICLSDKLRSLGSVIDDPQPQILASSGTPNLRRMAMLLEYIYLVNRVQLRDNYPVFEEKIESQTLVLLEEHHAQK